MNSPMNYAKSPLNPSPAACQTQSIFNGIFSTSVDSEFTNLPVRNSRGDVKLETIFKGGLAAVDRLTSSASTEPSLLPWARELETEAQAQKERARKCSAALKTLETVCDAYIAEMKPTWYDSVIDRERPEWFSCLRSLPLVELVLPSGMNKLTHKKDRKSRFSIILKSELKKKKKKTMKVLTSFKLKGPFLHPLMTPSLHNHGPRACSTAVRDVPEHFATYCRSSVRKSRCDGSITYRPSCKKSLYGKLPTGKKPMADDDSQDSSDDPGFPHLTRISEGVVQSTEQPRTSGKFKAVEKMPQGNRRSIDRIIERYRQLKSKANDSTTGFDK